MKFKQKVSSGIPLLLLFLLLTGVSLDASFQDSAEPVAYNRMTIGWNNTLTTAPAGLSYLWLGIGTTTWTSVYLQAGFGTDETGTNAIYGKALFKLLISRFFGGVDSVSLTVGPYYHNYPGVYSCLMLSTGYQFLQFYTGIDDTVFFRPSGADVIAHFLIGIKIKDKLNFLRIKTIIPSFVFEAGVPLTNYRTFTFSASLQYLFDFKINKSRS
jgi:hypothetical protein